MFLPFPTIIIPNRLLFVNDFNKFDLIFLCMFNMRFYIVKVYNFQPGFFTCQDEQSFEKIFVELDEHFRHVAQKKPRVLYFVELHKIRRPFLTNPSEGGKCKSFPRIPKNFQPIRSSKNPQESPAFSRARDFQELPARPAVYQGIGFLVEAPIFQNSDKLGLYCQVLRSWPILRNSDKPAYIPELRQARSILPSLEM